MRLERAEHETPAINRCSTRKAVVAWSLAPGLVACGGGGQGNDPAVIVTETDANGGDGGDGDGADGTGGEPTLISECMMQPKNGWLGYKYQCAGNISIVVEVEGDFDGAPISDSLTLEFGPGIEGDSYDHPHVMACCSEYDLGVPNCEQPHEQFCVADLVEQGCKSMEPNLLDFAEDEFGGASIEDGIKRAALKKIADYVRDHQADCLKEFIRVTGVGTTLPSCDADDNGVGYAGLLQSGVWSFDPDGAVTNVTISVEEANWTGLFPLDELPEQCYSAGDNDDVLFLELDPHPDSTIVHLVMGSAELDGPVLGHEKITGVAELGSEFNECEPGRCSTLVVLVDSGSDTASLENLEIYSAWATEVSTTDDAVIIDDFQVRLWDSTPAVFDPEEQILTIPPGAAGFAIGASSDGVKGVIAATNEEAFSLIKEPGGWSTSELVIGYEDEFGSHWSLVILPAQWQ